MGLLISYLLELKEALNFNSMKRFILLILVAGISLLRANADDGLMHRYELEVGAFDRLTLYDNAAVVYRSVPDSTGFIAYEGVEDFADAFLFENADGNLKIQVSTEDVGKPGLPVIRVYSDFLTSVENSSDSVVRIEASTPVPKFSAKLIGNGTILANGINATDVRATIVTGNGTISIEGVTRNAQLKMIGTGIIQADRLKADNVKCSVVGNGQIGCWAIEKLDVRGLGSSKIYYKGKPSVKKVGGGKIFPLESSSAEENTDSSID